MGSKPPKAPDPYKQAAAQRQENIWTSQYNTIGQNANQYTPLRQRHQHARSADTDLRPEGQHSGLRQPVEPDDRRCRRGAGDLQSGADAARLGFGQFANQQIGHGQGRSRQADHHRGPEPLATLRARARRCSRRNTRAPTAQAIENAMMDSFYRGVNPQCERENVQL